MAWCVHSGYAAMVLPDSNTKAELALDSDVLRKHTYGHVLPIEDRCSWLNQVDVICNQEGCQGKRRRKNRILRMT